MSKKTSAMIVTLMAACLLGWALPVVADDVDKAFETLKTYNWGDDRAALAAIDTAVAASHDDAAAQKALASRLAAVLPSHAPQAAKDFACRKLSLVGSAESVPAIAPLLTDEKLSHMARYALERMPCAEAVTAMREALPKTKGRLKVGIINSLGVRRDAEATGTLVDLLENDNAEIASAAAAALGKIGNAETAKALGDFQAKAPEKLRLAAADAYLSCAEQLLVDGKKPEAMMIYKTLSKSDQKHVKLAAMRGLLAATGQK